MDKIEQKIVDLIEQHKDEIIAIGRDIWKEPELGYKEYQTAGKFCRHLEKLSLIHISSQLLLGLINDVLDMSKIESGKMQLAETEFELGEWLAGVVTVTQSQTSVRGQHFDVNAWNITHELLCGLSLIHI